MNDFSDSSCSSKCCMGDLLRDFKHAIFQGNYPNPTVCKYKLSCMQMRFSEP